MIEEVKRANRRFWQLTWLLIGINLAVGAGLNYFVSSQFLVGGVITGLLALSGIWWRHLWITKRTRRFYDLEADDSRAAWSLFVGEMAYGQGLDLKPEETMRIVESGMAFAITQEEALAAIKVAKCRVIGSKVGDETVALLRLVRNWLTSHRESSGGDEVEKVYEKVRQIMEKNFPDEAAQVWPVGEIDLRVPAVDTSRRLLIINGGSGLSLVFSVIIVFSSGSDAPWRTAFLAVAVATMTVLVVVNLFRKSWESQLRYWVDRQSRERSDIEYVRILSRHSPSKFVDQMEIEAGRRLTLNGSAFADCTEKDMGIALSTLRWRDLSEPPTSEYAESLLVSVREWLRQNSHHKGYNKVRREYEKQLKRLREAGHGEAMALTQVGARTEDLGQ